MHGKRLRRNPFSPSASALRSALFVLGSTALSVAVGWKPDQFWPLVLAAAGLSGILSCIASRGKAGSGYFLSSLAFFFLGFLLAGFSFRVAPTGFGRFIVDWWPGFFLAGILCLFAARMYAKMQMKNQSMSGRGIVR